MVAGDQVRTGRRIAEGGGLVDDFLEFLREFANSRTGLLFLAAFSLSLVVWGVFLLTVGVAFGAALVAYGVVVGGSATAALRGKE